LEGFMIEASILGGIVKAIFIAGVAVGLICGVLWFVIWKVVKK